MIQERGIGMSYEVQLIYLLRIAVAGICGAMIGYERKNRSKEAGLGTHMIIAIGSALMMVLSKYAFFDAMGYDASRVASQIVSGIGFLGAGMIMVRRQIISGLTTAAGMWATSGVGMAIGAGLYVLGIGSALMIVLVQIVLHLRLMYHRFSTVETMTVILHESDTAIEQLQKRLETMQIELMHFKMKSHSQQKLEVEILVKIPHGFDRMKFLRLKDEMKDIVAIEL